MPRSTKSKRKLAILAIALTSIIWGVGAPIIKYTLEYIPTFSFLLIRFTFASLILYFFVDWKKGYLKHLGKKGLLKAFMLGVLGSSVYLSVLFIGIELTSSFEAIVISSSAPIFIVGGSILFLKEKVSRQELNGLMLALFGFSLIILRPLIESGFNVNLNLKGNILVLASIIGWSIYSIVSKNVFNHDTTGNKYSPVFIAFITFFAGAVTLIPFGLYEILTIESNYVKALPGVLYMTLIGTVLAYSLYAFAVKHLHVSETAIFQYTQPLFALPISIIILNEPFSPIYIVAGILVAAGVFLSEHHPVKVKRKKSK